MKEVLTILSVIGALIGAATGITALVSFSRKLKSDRVSDVEKACRDAEEDGRRKEREERMKTQIDAAHDKIRRLEDRQEETTNAITGIQADLKNAVGMLIRMEGKLDRYVEDRR